MKDVFITGHRNPDLDSVCSAYAYAVLKNSTDKSFSYKGIRCGHLSETTKQCLAAVGLECVPYMRDVYPKVKDVMNSASRYMNADDPVYNLVKTYDTSKPSAMPLFSNGEFYGLLSVDDITAWFLKDNSDEIPVYCIPVENICSVIPGILIKRGSDLENVNILAGAASIDRFTGFVTEGCNSVVVMGYRREHIEHAMKMQVPAIIVTTTESIENIDFGAYKGTVYATGLGTAETIRRLRMCVCLKDLVRQQGPELDVNNLFDDAKQMLIESNLRGLSVFEEGKWAGFVTRRCFLDKPKYNVILVDHNEVGQSIRGIETANVKEIIDHHRLDALKTDLPIFIDAEPLGSTCTIVYQQFLRHSVVPDKYTAKVLLTGIISDTIILKSPTTTDTDRSSAGALAALCGIYDIKSYGEKLFSGSKSLSQCNAHDAIMSDFKQYGEKGIKIGIGQYEVTTLKDLDDYRDLYVETLEKIKKECALDWAMLMVTDVLRDRSVLLVSDFRFNRKLPYSSIGLGVYDMPGVMSRKKQLLPEIIHAME